MTSSDDELIARVREALEKPPYQSADTYEALDTLARRLEELKDGLKLAYDHLRFHSWTDDPGSDERFDAVQAARALLQPNIQEKAEQ